MIFNKKLKIGLTSAFPLSALLFTSCDGDGDSLGSTVTPDSTLTPVASIVPTDPTDPVVRRNVIPDVLNAGDQIFWVNTGQQITLTIGAGNTIVFDGTPGTYTYTPFGSSKELIITFDGLADGQNAVNLINQVLENPTSNLFGIRSTFSNPPTTDELAAFGSQVASEVTEVSVFQDAVGNLVILEGFRVILPNNGMGIITNQAQGNGITVPFSGNVTLDGTSRYFSLPNGTGLQFTPAP